LSRLFVYRSLAVAAADDGVENLGFGEEFEWGFRGPVERLQGIKKIFLIVFHFDEGLDRLVIPKQGFGGIILVRRGGALGMIPEKSFRKNYEGR
jgi:hypothetical protein